MLWSSSFLKGLFIALLSLPFLLSPFVPLPAPDIPYLTHVATPLPKHPNEVTSGYASYFWVSNAELMFRDNKKSGMHPRIWNWRTGQIAALPGYAPPVHSTRHCWGFWPSPDGSYLIFAENESSRKKPFREWLYLLDLRSLTKKPGSLRHIPAERVSQPGWFPDSQSFLFWHTSRSHNHPTVPAKMCIQSVSGRIAAKIAVPHLNERGYTSRLLGVTSKGDMVHVLFSLSSYTGGRKLVRTSLRNAERPVIQAPLVYPRSLATISFGPSRILTTPRNKGQDRLLWVEQRTSNPLHYLGHQVNQLVANIRLRRFWFFPVEQYSVLWVSDVDGTNFHLIGRTPPGTNLLDQQWIPNSNQIAIRLQERNPDNTLKSDRFYFCPVE